MISVGAAALTEGHDRDGWWNQYYDSKRAGQGTTIFWIDLAATLDPYRYRSDWLLRRGGEWCIVVNADTL